MIDATIRVNLDALDGMDLEDQLAALLAVDGTDAVYCERCAELVDIEDSGESEVTGEWICLTCHAAEAAEQAAMIADVNAEMDAMHRARACRDEPVY